MLDNQAFGQQFGLQTAYYQLAGLFNDGLVDDLQAPKSTEVEFHLQQTFLGELALSCLNKPYFTLKLDQENYFIINNQKYYFKETEYYLRPWLVFLTICQIGGIDVRNELKNIQAIFQQLAPNVSTVNNQAKRLATFLNGKIGLIFTSQVHQSLGQWWRYCNESYAHNLCFCQNIEQLNFAAWTGHPVDKPFGVIDLITDFDDQQTHQLFIDKNHSLSGLMPASQSVKLHTSSHLQQLLELMLIGQITSFYLATLQQQSLCKH